jgi:hypothetical protein
MTVLCYRRWVLSTGDLPGEGAQEELTRAQSRSPEMREQCGLSTIWSSLLSCVGLFMMTMGPSHLRPLIGFDQQLILVAS